MDQLLDGIELKESSLDRVNSMKSSIHQRGFLSVRHLLKHAGYTDLDLAYESCGRPYLQDSSYISITHSFEFAAIIISQQNVGIDIEKKRDKIIKISTKFCNIQELDAVTKEKDSIEALTQIWCAKEAMFKMCKSRSLSFKDHMEVDLKGDSWVSKDEFECEFQYYKEDLQDFMLVYAFEKKAEN
ncbi:4'-phosphopantetheinyl transferase family protein [Myroides sp. LJL115]